MKRNLLITLTNLGLILCAVIVNVGCTNNTVQPIAKSIMETPSLIQSQTPASVDTSTVMPTKTFTPTQRPTMTATPPTPTITLIPTLTDDKRRAYIIDLFLHNGGCQYPCFWGLTPGKSTWEDARRLAIPLGDIPYTIEPGHKYELNLQDWQDGLNLGAILSIENDVIQSITSEQVLFVNSPHFIEMAKKQTSYSILEEYGPPDRVIVGLIGLQSEENPPHVNSSLSFYYDTKGFTVLFWPLDNVTKEDLYFKICPNVNSLPPPLKDSINMQIGIVQVHDRKSLDKINRDLLSRDDPEYPIETISDIGVIDFYKMVMSQKQSACFTTSISKWK